MDEVYVESGLVRHGFIHFAFLGQESQWAAEASECAADQDAFWEYYERIYDSQGGATRLSLNKDNLKQLAAEIGLDTQVFNECLDTDKHTTTVQNENQFARALGVSSTPSFVINGQPVIGAQPFEAFQQIIEAVKNEQ
ncbi:MAG: thioredoxin domain-containing protein [Anaerolineales bacterium]|nr:thioredoxin domain-containing protein [Anaerolineales bacterium]